MNSNKVAIITGAGSGMGRTTAKRLANDGYRIVLNGRTKNKLDSVAEEIGNEKCLVVKGDVSNEKDVTSIIEKTIEKFGQINVLVNNAGIFVGGNIDDVSLEDWNKQISINVTGPFLMTKKAMPHLQKTKGSIVNVSSVSGIGGDWNAFAYNTTKGALTNMTKALALDAASKNVRINAVAPSLTDTEMGKGAMEDKQTYKEFKKRIAFGRAGQPEEVADAIAFLASDDARFITGTILPVDGGLSASNGQPKL